MLSTESLPPTQVLPCLRSIGLMLESGTKIHEALAFAYMQSEDARLRETLADLHGAVARGKPLAHAMEAHPREFPRSLRMAVRAGEDSGTLAQVLRCLSEHYGHERKTRERLLNSLVYPLTVSMICLGVFAFLLVFIMPKLLRIHALNGVELPWLTALLLHLGKLAVSPLGLGALAVGGGLAVALAGTAEGRGLVERLLHRLPVIGPVLHSGRVARFCGLLSVLLRGGMPLNAALDHLAARFDDEAFSRSIEEVSHGLLRGESFAVAMRDRRVLPEDVIHLLQAGQETDRIEPLLDEAAQMHRELVHGRSKTLLSLVEPAFILVLGSGVALMVIAMYLPLIRLTSCFVGSF